MLPSAKVGLTPRRPCRCLGWGSNHHPAPAGRLGLRLKVACSPRPTPLSAWSVMENLYAWRRAGPGGPARTRGSAPQAVRLKGEGIRPNAVHLRFGPHPGISFSRFRIRSLVGGAAVALSRLGSFRVASTGPKLAIGLGDSALNPVNFGVACGEWGTILGNSWAYRSREKARRRTRFSADRSAVASSPRRRTTSSFDNTVNL